MEKRIFLGKELFGWLMHKDDYDNSGKRAKLADKIIPTIDDQIDCIRTFFHLSLGKHDDRNNKNCQHQQQEADCLSFQAFVQMLIEA